MILLDVDARGVHELIPYYLLVSQSGRQVGWRVSFPVKKDDLSRAVQSLEHLQISSQDSRVDSFRQLIQRSGDPQDLLSSLPIQLLPGILRSGPTPGMGAIFILGRSFDVSNSSKS